MELEKINTGNEPNDGAGDVLRDAWVKVNNNFSRLSGVFNIKLSRVKETDSIEDLKPNFDIVNENFKLIENRLK